MISAFDRLRWLVLVRFGVMPGSDAERSVQRGDILFAGLNMVLDKNQGAFDGESNPDFDTRRFDELRRGGA
jgi:hypothetical protein